MAKYFPKERQFWNCSKDKKGYSGTAILVSKTFPEPISVSYDFGIRGRHDREGRTITVHFDTFILVAVYVPNSGVQGLQRLKYRVDEWDVDFQAYLKDLE